jgi:hypothetical protein
MGLGKCVQALYVVVCCQLRCCDTVLAQQEGRDHTSGRVALALSRPQANRHAATIVLLPTARHGLGVQSRQWCTVMHSPKLVVCGSVRTTGRVLSHMRAKPC